MFGKSPSTAKRRRRFGAATALVALTALTACETLTPRQTIDGYRGFESTGRFGQSVALSGNGLVMVVGVPAATWGGRASGGLVRVYQREDVETSWALVTILALDTPAAQQAFGTSVAINNTGSVIAVGAPGTSTYTSAGNAYVFSRVARGDAYMLSTSLIASGFLVDKDQRFGTSVALSKEGFRLAVGAPGGDAKTTDTGKIALGNAGVVEVFDMSSGAPGSSMGWKRQARVSDLAPQANSNFGRSIAMSEDGMRLIVGSPNYKTIVTDDGRAAHFGYENGSLGNSFYFREAIADGPTNDAIRDTKSYFGWSVAISADGKKMAVGAPGFGSNVGAALVQTLDPATGLFSFTKSYAKLTTGAGTPGSVGYAIDLSGDGSRLMIGAPTSNGSVGAWGLVNTKTHELEYGNAGGAAEQLGASVAISDAGQMLAVGAPGANSSNGQVKLSDTFKTPATPTISTATPGDTFVGVTWQASNNVTADLRTTYKVYSGNVLLCSTIGTACLISGLKNGTEYSFTVTASNAIGTSLASAVLKATPLATIVNPQLPAGFADQVAVGDSTEGAEAGAGSGAGAGAGAASLTGLGSAPDAPTGLKVVGGRRNVKISWIAPANNGGQEILGYTVTASPGGRTCLTTDVATTSCVITKLGDLKKYTFAVTASNIVGTGSASDSSRVVWTQPKVSRTKAATAKDIAKFAGLKMPTTATFSVKLTGKKSPDVCAMKAGAVIGKTSGSCKVRVSVTNKGVTTSKNVVLRIVR